MIEKMFEAANGSTNMRLSIPEGTYYLEDGVKNRPIIEVVGANNLTVVGFDTILHKIGAGGPILRFTNCNGVSVAGIKATLPGSPNDRGFDSAIQFMWCDNVTVNRCHVQGGNGSGIAFAAPVRHKDQLDEWVEGCSFTDNTFTKCQKSVVLFGPVHNCIVANSVFNDCNVGVFVDDRSTKEIFLTGHQPTGISIQGNIFNRCCRRPSSASIRVTCGVNVMVANNIINDPGFHSRKASFGVLVNDSVKKQSTNVSRNVMVTGNMITRPRSYSMSIRGENCVERGNEVIDPKLRDHLKYAPGRALRE